MKISLIIPAYNSSQTIGQCLDAVKKSSFKNYEIILVDDGSTDETPRLAKLKVDVLIKNQSNLGPYAARIVGLKKSKGEIAVFIDSDVLVKKDTLEIINQYFSKHKNVDALTGLLSKDHPHKNFFSQYKNLYMNYIFNKLPDRVHFLYGSIFALRQSKVLKKDSNRKNFGEDTDWGQIYSRYGRHIAFLRNLEVIHLKKYSFISWMRNDFRVPWGWAEVFLKNKGWKQLGREGVGYAHSPKEQLICVGLAPLIVFGGILSVQIPLLAFPTLLGVGIWFLLNIQFFLFMIRHRGPVFGGKCILITLIDHVVMALGVFLGGGWFLVKKLKIS